MFEFSADHLNKRLVVTSSGEFTIEQVYRAIQAWMASDEGADVAEWQRAVVLPDRVETPGCLLLHGPWKLAAAVPVTIVGHVAVEGADGTEDPIDDASREWISLPTNEEATRHSQVLAAIRSSSKKTWWGAYRSTATAIAATLTIVLAVCAFLGFGLGSCH